MKINVLHKVYWVALATLVLVSSIGLSIDMHFCKGEFKSFSFVGEAKQCHTAKITCPHHAKMELEKKSDNSCCSNQTLEVEEIDFDYYAQETVQIEDFQVSSNPIHTQVFVLNQPQKASLSTFLENQVLLPSKDIYVQLGRFLI